MTSPKIICSSDIPFNLDCLHSFLSKSSNLQLNGKFHLGDLFNHFIHQDFDILVLDICELTDSDLLKQVFVKFQEKKIMVLTASNNHYFLSSLLHLGASGCFVKSAPGLEFIEALLELNTNNAYLPKELFNKLFCELSFKFNHGVNRVIQNTNHAVPILNINALTTRELEILRLIIAGQSSGQIADELFISESTVCTHRKHILKKLGVNNTSTLIRCALEQGFN